MTGLHGATSKEAVSTNRHGLSLAAARAHVSPSVHNRVSGGKCVSPDQCAHDPGWHGKFCEKEICEVERVYGNDAGDLIEDLGCYHGGRCLGIGVDCVGARVGLDKRATWSQVDWLSSGWVPQQH